MFFLFSAYTGRYDETLTEQWFDFPRYWRTIGWVGFAITGILYIVLARLTLYNNGRVRISAEKIELVDKQQFKTFETSRIKNLVFTKDIPYKTDERNDSQRASRLKFEYQGRTVDLEIRTRLKSDFEQLLPISKLWQQNIAGYREEYK